jgi:HAMP domain-containing protein
VKVLLKVNIVLVVVFLIALAASYSVAQRLLLENARLEIRDNARIMMESAKAVRTYTASQIAPLLTTQMRYQFLPQSVPSYSATEYFNNLRRSFPEYDYKEAALNPTNPRDRAVDWEVDVVNHFRESAAAKEVLGERDGATGRTLYLARPLRIEDPGCLACHSAVEKAPPTMIDHYGTANGFGWRLQEVVGAQIVSVPWELPLRRANSALRGFVYLLGSSFLFLFVTVNLCLTVLVLRPVRRLAAIADQVSLGNMNAPQFLARGNDEITALGVSFNRLRRSVEEAMSMLEHSDHL